MLQCYNSKILQLRRRSLPFNHDPCLGFSRPCPWYCRPTLQQTLRHPCHRHLPCRGSSSICHLTSQIPNFTTFSDPMEHLPLHEHRLTLGPTRAWWSFGTKMMHVPRRRRCTVPTSMAQTLLFKCISRDGPAGVYQNSARTHRRSYPRPRCFLRILLNILRIRRLVEARTLYGHPCNQLRHLFTALVNRFS